MQSPSAVRKTIISKHNESGPGVEPQMSAEEIMVLKLAVKHQEALCACYSRVELRTQDAERGLNSEEAEKLVWAAQTIFATGCESFKRPMLTALDMTAHRHPSTAEEPVVLPLVC